MQMKKILVENRARCLLKLLKSMFKARKLQKATRTYNKQCNVPHSLPKATNLVLQVLIGVNICQILTK